MTRRIKPWIEGYKRTPRMLIISGAGGLAFSAGGNLTEIYNTGIGLPDPQSKIDVSNYFGSGYLLAYSIT